MTIRVYEITDPKYTYGYLTVDDNVSVKEVQEAIDTIKATIEIDDYTVYDIFNKFPFKWDFKDIAAEVAI
jgi:hypothetical protein